METLKKAKVARTLINQDGEIYSTIEYTVCETYKIKSKKDIDFVSDRLVDGYYNWAILHARELQNLLDNKKKKYVQSSKRRPS